MILSHVDDTFTVLKVLMILSHACPCIVSPLLPLFLPPFELLLFHDPYLALFYPSPHTHPTNPPTPIPGICPSCSQKPTTGPSGAPHPVMGLTVAILGGLYKVLASLVEHMMGVGQPLKSTLKST